MEHIFDVIIIGAGPIGMACGIEAKRKGLDYVIIEKGSIVNSVFHYPTNMTFFSTAEKIEIGGVPFVSHGDKPTRREALEYFRRVKAAYGLLINTYEKVIDVKADDTNYKINTNKNSYLTKNIIIATGYYDNPVNMNIEGEDLPKVRHYFDEPHPYAYQKTAVIGAGNSAVDVALELFRVGAEVTMVIREPKIKLSIKYWVKPDIENRINENSIKAYFNSYPVEIKKSSIVIQTPEGLVEIENDYVFAMTGYSPDHNFLRSIGLQLDEENCPVFNRETLQTNLKGIYLAGVVCSGKNTDKYFIENSIGHAKIITDQIAGSLKLIVNS
ncbi:MAG: YpdA family putative bacillithiol disulfide reductase [bacterium]|nr:YpdA family putative bacillithiol disulfide reductase [bacterium]